MRRVMSSAESLSIEVIALEAARKQLVRGDAKTALALLEEYAAPIQTQIAA